MSRNPLVFAGAVLVASLVLLFGFVFPKGREAAEVRGALAAEQANLVSLQMRLQDLRATDPVALESLAVRYRNLVPDAVELQQLLALLDQLAADSGVKISTVSVSTPSAASAAAVSMVALSLSVQGQYFSIAEFLFSLEHASRLIRATSISLSGDQGGGGIQLNVSVEAYTTDVNAGPGSDPAPGPEVGA